MSHFMTRVLQYYSLIVLGSYPGIIHYMPYSPFLYGCYFTKLKWSPHTGSESHKAIQSSTSPLFAQVVPKVLTI